MMMDGEKPLMSFGGHGETRGPGLVGKWAGVGMCGMVVGKIGFVALLAGWVLWNHWEGLESAWTCVWHMVWRKCQKSRWQ